MRILYLCSRKYYEQKMSRGARFHCPAAVGEQDGVELRWSGNGWPDWDATKTCTENFARWSWRPDWLWCYKPEDHLGVAESVPRKLVTYNETWPDRPGLATSEVNAMKADLVVCHHESGLRDFDGFAGQIVHIPHAAKVDIFHAPVNSCRPVDCLVSGVISDEIYPLRGRLKRLVEGRQLPGKVLGHPGYRLASADACERQVRDYARQLADTKIALCCTSKYRYPLAKLYESALAGCVVATDMPDDKVFQETLGRHIIQLDGSWTDSELVHCLRSHLSQPKALLERAIATQDVALEHYTMDCYAKKLLGALHDAEKNIAA